MKVVKSKWYIYIVLVIVIITYIFLIGKSKINNQIKLEEVKLKEEINEITKNNFAIMVEKEDGSGYEEADSFPTDMTLNPNLSGCIDEEGKTISGSLAYKDGKVSVHVNSTAYCYLYFYKDEETPVVTASVINNETENAKMVITSSESGTYCVNTSSTVEDMSSCVFEGTIYGGVSLTTDVFTDNGSYYVHVKDGAENIGISNGVDVSVGVTGNSFSQYLIENDISGLQKEYIGNDTLYRFSGTTGNTGINNYICLGTTSCTSGDDNMYRIIGVEPSTGYVKVIKEIQYGAAERWNSTASSVWASSASYSKVNVTWYGSINFVNIIEEHSWNVNTVSSKPTTRIDAYDSETGSTINAYVGIISLSDFYLAYKADQDWNNDSTSGHDIYVNNWIHPVNNVNDVAEWTMTSYSASSVYLVFTNGTYKQGSAGQTFTNGGVSTGSVSSGSNGTRTLRPVFYLKASVAYVSGSGTSSDPFIVELSE